MSLSSSVTTLTSSFLVCEPSPMSSSSSGSGTNPTMAGSGGITTVFATVTNTFTQTYCVTLPAACPTSEWMATYTVVEICTGKKEDWVTPACPSNFVVTTVPCDVCQDKQKVITCPNALATETNIKVLDNNGVTATVPPSLAVYPAGPVTPAPVPGGGTPGTGPGGVVPGGGAPGGGAGNGMPPPGPAKTSYVVAASAPRSLKNGLLFVGAVAFAASHFIVA